MITDVYGEKFHPFAEKGKFSESKHSDLTDLSTATSASPLLLIP
jgi:hypothetical protein